MLFKSSADHYFSIFFLQDRVKSALDKIEEQESSGHRKRRTHHKAVVVSKDNDLVKIDHKSRTTDKDVPKKIRPKALPPEAALSFDQILKLAAAKQHEPVKIEKKLPEVPERKGPESDRLMTKKEKEDLMRRKEEERDRQLRKEGKLPPITTVTPTPPAQPSKSKDNKPPAKVIPTKEPPKAPSSLLGKSIKPSSVAGPAIKPIVRSEDNRDVAPKPNDAKRLEASKGIPNKPRPPQMKNPPSRPLPNSQPSRVPQGIPQGKGKSLAPAGPSRPFPPYRDIRPVGRPYKSIIDKIIFCFGVDLTKLYFF